MGYDLHITRAAWWTRSEEYPVAQDEWQALADVWPGMAVEGGGRLKDTSRVPAYELHGVGEHPTSFTSGDLTATRCLGDGAIDGDLVEHEADDPIVGGQRDLLEPGEDTERDPFV